MHTSHRYYATRRSWAEVLIGTLVGILAVLLVIAVWAAAAIASIALPVVVVVWVLQAMGVL